MYRPYMEECSHCRRPILIQINFPDEIDEKTMRQIFVEHWQDSDLDGWAGKVRDWIKRVVNG